MAEVEQMGTTECWRLVEQSDLCRLAVDRADGGPDVFPMNYVVHDGALYLRSAPGGKLRSLVSRPAVALEVDGEEDGYRWSVVIRGAAQHLFVDAEIAASGVLRLVSMSPTSKHEVIRVAPRTITGRRFRAVEPSAPQTPAENPPAEVTAEVAADAPAPLEPPDSTHGKPQPIPHTSPLNLVEPPHRPED